MIEIIAKVCHEANRVYCQSMGDHSQVPWEDAPEWQRSSAMDGVRFHLAHPEANADASHNNWMNEKVACGWTYGETKDVEAKRHPCMVLFEELPPEQQAKDHLFRGIVHALQHLVPKEACA